MTGKGKGNGTDRKGAGAGSESINGIVIGAPLVEQDKDNQPPPPLEETLVKFFSSRIRTNNGKLADTTTVLIILFDSIKLLLDGEQRQILDEELKNLTNIHRENVAALELLDKLAVGSSFS